MNYRIKFIENSHFGFISIAKKLFFINILFSEILEYSVNNHEHIKKKFMNLSVFSYFKKFLL